MFADDLQYMMLKRRVSQAALSKMTGIGRASICQYLQGKNIPKDDRKREIAKALDLEPDYFIKRDPARAAMPPERIERMSVTNAAKAMGLSKATISQGLRDGVFPWGYAIKGKGESWIYWINAKRFMEIECAREVSMGEMENVLQRERERNAS